MSEKRVVRGTTEVTIGEMANLAIKDRTHSVVRRTAEKIVAGLPPKDKTSEALAIYYWFCDPKNFRYVEDPAGIEYVKAPHLTLAEKSGDCDCVATCIASLLLSINIPCQFVRVGFDKHQYSHVLVRAYPGGLSSIPIILDPVAIEKGQDYSPIMRERVQTGGIMFLHPVMEENSVPSNVYSLGSATLF